MSPSAPRLSATLDDLRARQTQSPARLDDLRARWSALWAPLGIAAPGTPREMLAWSRKAADLAALAGSVREKAEAVARREEQRSAPPPRACSTLSASRLPLRPTRSPTSIDRAQELIDAVAKESKARDS